MNKRQFISIAAMSSAALPLFAATPSTCKAGGGAAMLTITGAIGASNRGPFDPALDQMMHKQKISFDKAYAFDLARLSALTAVHVKPTLEYDLKRHVLSGPLLLDVIALTGAKLRDGTKLLLRAVDGYAVIISAEDARNYRFIVATHLDGQPLPLGGLGPLWAIFDADRFPDMASKPVNERFGVCPWALYHIEVQAT